MFRTKEKVIVDKRNGQLAGFAVRTDVLKKAGFTPPFS
jgi:hypothetical protein